MFFSRLAPANDHSTPASSPTASCTASVTSSAPGRAAPVTLLARLTATRAGYLDNLIGTQTAGTYSHPSGTTESDAVVITPAELGKYEKLVLDMSNLTQTTTVRTYVQVDGVNYRLIDAAEYPTDFPTNAKGVVIELTPSNRTQKVTLQSAVAEGVARDIPYFYVVRSLA